jgi:DNA-binding response OmpR family regulator
MFRILAIENDKKIAMLIDRKLMNLGYNVMLTYSEFVGERLALNVEYDLIITDFSLSKNNGLEFCKKIKIQKPDTPIMMLMGFDNNRFKVQEFTEAAGDYPVQQLNYEDLEISLSLIMKKTQGSTRLN